MGLSGNRETSRMLLDISTGYPGMGWERVMFYLGHYPGPLLRWSYHRYLLSRC